MSGVARAVEADPDNRPLRRHLASLLLDSGDAQAALDQAAWLVATQPDDLGSLAVAEQAAEAVGDQERAASYRRLIDVLGPKASPPSGLSPAPTEAQPRLAAEGPMPESPMPESVADLQRLWDVSAAEPEPDLGQVEAPSVRLADVGGMVDVKERLERGFFGPLRNPELMAAFGKTARGGLLLYGPPGCGKTFLARAIAGELGAKFYGIELADVLDMWIGSSERNLHEVFEYARRNQPCVLFFDEIDALGQKRTNLRSSPAMRGVVNQLLSEMDGLGADNAGVFILGATNQPWDVDSALQRPGRFDRTILVLPPDEEARAHIIATHLSGRPTAGVDPADLARRTDGYSGADLMHVCETAVEAAMADSMRTGSVEPVTAGHLRAAVTEVRPSVEPWMAMARNVATFANGDGRYDDLVAYLKRR